MLLLWALMSSPSLRMAASPAKQIKHLNEMQQLWRDDVNFTRMNSQGRSSRCFLPQITTDQIQTCKMNWVKICKTQNYGRCPAVRARTESKVGLRMNGQLEHSADAAWREMGAY